MPALPSPAPRSAFQIELVQNGLCIQGGLSESLLLGSFLSDALGSAVVQWESTPRSAAAVSLSQTLAYTAALAAAPIDTELALLTPGLPPAMWLATLLGARLVPARFLVGVQRLTDLERLLDEAEQDGIPAVAQLGLDHGLSWPAVAWVIPTSLPKAYHSLATSWVEMGVAPGAPAHPEGSALPLSQRVSVVLPQSGWGRQTRAAELASLAALIPDLPLVQLRQVAPVPIGDWESAAPDLCQPATRLMADETAALYTLASTLSASWIADRWEGVLLSPYGLGAPRTEFSARLLPAPYWQGSPRGAAAALERLAISLPSQLTVLELEQAPQVGLPAQTRRVRVRSLEKREGYQGFLQSLPSRGPLPAPMSLSRLCALTEGQPGVHIYTV